MTHEAACARLRPRARGHVAYQTEFNQQKRSEMGDGKHNTFEHIMQENVKQLLSWTKIQEYYWPVMSLVWLMFSQ